MIMYHFCHSVFQVLPRTGQLIVHVQTSPPVAMAAERITQEVSSGAGELSDSMSVGEVAVSHVRKKKSRVTELIRLVNTDTLSREVVLFF